MAAETLRIGLDRGPQAILDLPAGARHDGPAGADSVAGTITGAHAGAAYTCVYDLGVYANPLTGRAGTETLTISGKPARLVRDGDFLGLHVPDLAREGLGVSGLTLTCKGPGVAGDAGLVAMLRGVRLRL